MSVDTERMQVIYAERGCLVCGGGAASVPLEDATASDYCDCIWSQVSHAGDRDRLLDGEIEVRVAK